jgi:acyl carrier protein
MQPTAPSIAAKPNEQESNLRRLPAAAQTAFLRFQETGDDEALAVVLFAVLEDFIPRAPALPLLQTPGETRLVDDLGFDSLAITEVVFFTEDLFGIRIANEEIIRVRTLDDLRRFVRTKISHRVAG